MKWYNEDGELIYGPKTAKAFGIACGWIDVEYYMDKTYTGGERTPIYVVQKIEQYNLMTDEIRKELQDYIFVDA